MITQEELKLNLTYDPERGSFTHNRTVNQVKIGSIAGTKDTKGYIQIRINGKKYLAHRLAWLYMTGEFPKLIIDHINGVKDFNIFSNLREATCQQNSINSKVKSNSLSGIKGISLTKNGTYRITMRIDRKQIYIGTFKDLEFAQLVYGEAQSKYHGEFARKVK